MPVNAGNNGEKKMIGTLDVECQAKNPNLPLAQMTAFVNSPSSLRIRNVPKRIGDWCIRNVYVTCVYPDATTKSVQCVLVGGVYVGTIQGTSTSGTSKNGYTIFADGTDENGNNVTGYVLGKGDINILEADGQLNPDAKLYYVHLLSSEGQTHNEGDLWQNDGTYYIWQNGQAWPIGDDSGVIGELSAKVDEKADLSAIHGDYITNGESTISANRAWSEKRGYVWTVTIWSGTYVLSCNEDGTSTWDQCELLEDGEGYEFWGRTIGCYEDDILFFKLEYDIEGAVFHLTMKDKRDSWPAYEYTLVPDEPLMQYLPHGPFGDWDAIVSYMPWTKTGILTTEDYVDEAISGKADLSTLEDYIPYTIDSDGDKSSLTIGTRKPDSRVGQFSFSTGANNAAEALQTVAMGYNNKAQKQDSIAIGQNNNVAGSPAVAIGKGNNVSCTNGVCIGDTNTISGTNAVAIGTMNKANGDYAIAMGGKARANSDGSFTWSGSNKANIVLYPQYFDHGKGTFNVNPVGGLSGFYIGEQSLNDILSSKADLSAIPTNTSQLSNDSGFTTKTYVDGIVGDINSALDAINGEVI